LGVHFPQLLRLESLGLKPIDSLNDLVEFLKADIKRLNKTNPYDSIKERSLFNGYGSRIKLSFAAWLKLHTCEICKAEETARVFNFHHLNPDDKEGGVSQLSTGKDKRKFLLEITKCVYVCETCHQDLHLAMGVHVNDYENINRWRHSSLQGVLGSSTRV